MHMLYLRANMMITRGPAEYFKRRRGMKSHYAARVTETAGGSPGLQHSLLSNHPLRNQKGACSAP